MTYSNFARRKGSKDKKKRNRFGGALKTAGKVALGAGLATAYLKRDNLKALGSQVANAAMGTQVGQNVVNAAKAGASLAGAGTSMAKRAVDKATPAQVRRARRQASVAAERAKRNAGLSKSNRKEPTVRRRGPREITIE